MPPERSPDEARSSSVERTEGNPALQRAGQPTSGTRTRVWLKRLDRSGDVRLDLGAGDFIDSTLARPACATRSVELCADQQLGSEARVDLGSVAGLATGRMQRAVPEDGSALDRGRPRGADVCKRLSDDYRIRDASRFAPFTPQILPASADRVAFYKRVETSARLPRALRGQCRYSAPGVGTCLLAARARRLADRSVAPGRGARARRSVTARARPGRRGCTSRRLPLGSHIRVHSRPRHATRASVGRSPSASRCSNRLTGAVERHASAYRRPSVSYGSCDGSVEAARSTSQLVAASTAWKWALDLRAGIRRCRDYGLSAQGTSRCRLADRTAAATGRYDILWQRRDRGRIRLTCCLWRDGVGAASNQAADAEVDRPSWWNGEPAPAGHADALPDDLRLVAPEAAPGAPEERLSRDGDVRASAPPAAHPALRSAPGDSTEGAGEALVTRCAKCGAARRTPSAASARTKKRSRRGTREARRLYGPPRGMVVSGLRRGRLSARPACARCLRAMLGRVL